MLKFKFLQNPKVQKVKKGLSFALVLGFLLFVVYLLYNSYFKSVESQKNEAQNLQNKIKKIDQRLLIAKLDQKSERLKIAPLHLKYPEIIDYSFTILPQNTKFTNNGNTVILPKNTRLIVLKTQKEDYFYFKKVILKKVEK